MKDNTRPMPHTACASPVPWEALMDHFAGQVDAAEAERIEDHVFGCEPCSERWTAAAAFVTKLRAAARTGSVTAVIDALTLDRMVQAGVRIKQVLPREGLVDAGYEPGVDLMVTRLPADLRGIPVVDVEFHTAYAGLSIERDVPVTSEGEIIIACSRRHFRNPRGPLETKLQIVDAQDPQRRVIATYQMRMASLG